MDANGCHSADIPIVGGRLIVPANWKACSDPSCYFCEVAAKAKAAELDAVEVIKRIAFGNDPRRASESGARNTKEL